MESAQFQHVPVLEYGYIMPMKTHIEVLHFISQLIVQLAMFIYVSPLWIGRFWLENKQLP